MADASDKPALSDPITLRIPQDILAEVEQIAKATERSRSWVIVRALKYYLMAEEQRHPADPERGGAGAQRRIRGCRGPLCGTPR